MKCCGVERESTYCPDCGSNLEGNQIKQIARFVRGKLKSALVVEARVVKNDKENPERLSGENKEYFIKRRERRIKKIRQLERWAATLDKIAHKES